MAELSAGVWEDVAPVDDLVLVLHMCEIRILVFCL